MASGKDPHRDLEGALHEVSNALTVLLGWIAEARDPSASPGDVLHALRIVEERARTARNLARRAIGAAVPAGGDLEVGELMRAVTEALTLEAERAGVTLEVRALPPARLPLGEDVVQIVTNLVLNAFAHAPKGSSVAIEGEADGNAVRIDVCDSGPGVADERSERIFEGESTRDGGAGVGLRHARAMARAAGGDLGLVASASADGGARFRLTWPRALPVPAPPRSVPRAKLLEGLRVLVLEDDRDVTDLLEAALGARGAEVTVARTAAELDARLEATHGAVLVDLSPIAKDPSGAVERMRVRAKDAAIVLITGSAERIPPGLEGTTWVRKPFEVGEVVDVLVLAKKSYDALAARKTKGTP